MLRTCLSILLVACCMLITTSVSNAKDFTTNPQILIVAGDTMTTHIFSETLSIGIFAQGAGLLDLNAHNHQLFGYLGVKLTIENTSMYYLTGTYMTIDGGTSVIGSIWLEQSKLFVDSLSFFLEFDAYFPVPTFGTKHKVRQYYVLSNLMWHASDKTALGAQAEFFFDESDLFEAAVGPAIQVSKFNIWVAYDATPADKKMDSFILRFTVSI